MALALRLSLALGRYISGVAPPSSDGAVLIEIGDYLLLETGDKLLLE